MFKLTKETAVETVLQKRFGTISPSEIPELNEVNIWYSVDDELHGMGYAVELKFENGTEENYQVNTEGIIYSWGESPIIDERSQKTSLTLEKVYKNMQEEA